MSTTSSKDPGDVTEVAFNLLRKNFAVAMQMLRGSPCILRVLQIATFLFRRHRGFRTILMTEAVFFLRSIFAQFAPSNNCDRISIATFLYAFCVLLFFK